MGKPEHFLAGVKLLQANTEWLSLYAAPLFKEGSSIFSWSKTHLKVEASLANSTFTIIPSHNPKAQKINQGPWALLLQMMSQARDPRQQTYLQGFSKASAHVMLPQYGSHNQLRSLHSLLWVTGTKIWNISIGKPQDTQPASPQHFQAVLNSSHECWGNTSPLWWGHISQCGNPKQVLHLCRTACPDPAGFFRFLGLSMTLDWYKLLILRFKQCNNQTCCER